MTCYIFGAAPMGDLRWMQERFHKRSEDLLICADGGYHLARALGITPEWLVGDFDSMFEEESGESLEISPEHIVRFDPHKDDTDLALALAQGRNLGYIDFVIYGVTGGRFDHEIGVVQLLCGMTSDPALTVRVEAEGCTYFCLKDGQVTLENFADVTAGATAKSSFQRPRRTFSVFSLAPESVGVTIRGAAYELCGASLFYDRPLGISNEIVAEVATVKVESGTLLIVLEQR